MLRNYVCVPETHAFDAFGQVFSQFFTFNASLQLPFLPWNGEIAPGIYAAVAKGIVVFSDDSKYFTDE